MQHQPTPKKSGGKRPGAGRKPTQEKRISKMRSYTLSEPALWAIDDYEGNKSALISELILKYFNNLI